MQSREELEAKVKELESARSQLAVKEAELERVYGILKVAQSRSDWGCSACEMYQGVADAITSPAAEPEQKADGFVLMPRNLTNEMVRAFCMATVQRWDDAPEDQKIEVAEKLQHAFDAVIAVAPKPAEQQPAPDVAGLAEAAEAALGEIEAIIQEAYNSAYPVCCGRYGSECCGSPEPEWHEADQRMVERLEPHQEALREALAAHHKQRGDV